MFHIEFDDIAVPALHTDESAPLRGDSDPNPSRMLVVAVANCLNASLQVTAEKFRARIGVIE